jgi:hypothetical protein
MLLRERCLWRFDEGTLDGSDEIHSPSEKIRPRLRILAITPRQRIDQCDGFLPLYSLTSSPTNPELMSNRDGKPVRC